MSPKIRYDLTLGSAKQWLSRNPSAKIYLKGFTYPQVEWEGKTLIMHPQTLTRLEELGLLAEIEEENEQADRRRYWQWKQTGVAPD